MPDTALALAVISPTIIFGGIILILLKRGFRVIISACLFVVCLVAVQIGMKGLTTPPLAYKSPAFVTTLHFLTLWVACVLYWAYVGEMEKCWPSSMESGKRFMYTVLPIALSNPLTVIFNNKALVYAGAGLCAVVATLSPIAVAIISRFFGRTLPAMAWLGVFVAFSGAVIITQFEARDSLKKHDASAVATMTGMIFALLSILFRTLKIVLMDMIMSPKDYRSGGVGVGSHKVQEISPMHLFVLSAPWMFLVSALFAGATESLEYAWNRATPHVAIMIATTCALAVGAQFFGILVLKDLGGTLQQIIGKLNTICIMSISVGVLGEQLPPVVVLGSVVVLLGVAIFEGSKSSCLKVADDVASIGSDDTAGGPPSPCASPRTAADEASSLVYTSGTASTKGDSALSKLGDHSLGSRPIGKQADAITADE